MLPMMATFAAVSFVAGPYDRLGSKTAGHVRLASASRSPALIPVVSLGGTTAAGAIVPAWWSSASGSASSTRRRPRPA